MLQRIEQTFRNPGRCPRPYVDYLIVSLTIGDKTSRILTVYLVDILLCFGNDLLFLLRDRNIIKTDRKTTSCCIMESNVF